MHRRSKGNQNLVPFNPEIEATACQRGGEARRRKKAEVVMAKGDNRMLQDYTLPQASSITASIVSPVVEANDFELSPALITFAERCGERSVQRTSLRQSRHAPSQIPCEV